MSASQSSEHHRSRSSEEEVEEAPPQASTTSKEKEALDAEVDAMLDEIDEVLEHNAEEFVRGFVQKGGQ